MSNTILPPPKDLVARLETGNNEYNEDTPLISSYQDCRQSSSPDEPHGQNKCYSPVYITVVMCLIYFVVDLASNGNVTSRLVIFEDLICDDYYSRVMGGKSRDRDCKIEPVQSELAFINGWRNTLECLPGNRTNRTPQPLNLHMLNKFGLKVLWFHFRMGFLRIVMGAKRSCFLVWLVVCWVMPGWELWVSHLKVI